MSCNAGAFAPGDKVIVQFAQRDPDDPYVIGFQNNPKPCQAGQTFSQQPDRFLAGSTVTTGPTWRQYAIIDGLWTPSSAANCGTPTDIFSPAPAYGGLFRATRASTDDNWSLEYVESLSGTFTGRVTGKVILIDDMNQNPFRYWRSDLCSFSRELYKRTNKGELALDSQGPPFTPLQPVERFINILAQGPGIPPFPDDAGGISTIDIRILIAQQFGTSLMDPIAERDRRNNFPIMADGEEVLYSGAPIPPVNEDMIIIQCAWYDGYIMKFDALAVYNGTDVKNCGGRKLYGIEGVQRREGVGLLRPEGVISSQPTMICGGQGPTYFFVADKDSNTNNVEVRRIDDLSLVSTASVVEVTAISGDDTALIICSGAHPSSAILSYRDPLSPGIIISSVNLGKIVLTPRLGFDPIFKRPIFGDSQAATPTIRNHLEAGWPESPTPYRDGQSLQFNEPSFFFSKDGLEIIQKRQLATFGGDFNFKSRRVGTFSFVGDNLFQGGAQFAAGIAGCFNPPRVNLNRRFTSTISFEDGENSYWLTQINYPVGLFQLHHSDPGGGATQVFDGKAIKFDTGIVLSGTDAFYFEEMPKDETLTQTGGAASVVYPELTPISTFTEIDKDQSLVYKGADFSGVDTLGNSIMITPLLHAYNGLNKQIYYLLLTATSDTISGRVDASTSTGFTNGNTATWGPTP